MLAGLALRDRWRFPLADNTEEVAVAHRIADIADPVTLVAWDVGPGRL